MALRIQNNVEAFNAHRNLTSTSAKAAKAMEKLSSGYRINRAADDAAGLAISEKMRAQISGLGQAQRNAQDGISLVQTAEGALTEVHSMLNRIRELKVQHDNSTLSTEDKAAITSEVTALTSEITAIGDETKFNGEKVFNPAAALNFVVGADGEKITLATTALDFDGAVTGWALADADMTNFDAAIEAVSTIRAELGAVQNRLEHRLNNLGTYQENLVAAESRIRDVDMAQEMVNFSKLQILQQAGTAMLAQANQSSQGVLSLLR
jgi:flagellin